MLEIIYSRNDLSGNFRFFCNLIRSEGDKKSNLLRNLSIEFRKKIQISTTQYSSSSYPVDFRNNLKILHGIQELCLTDDSLKALQKRFPLHRDTSFRDWNLAKENKIEIKECIWK